MSLRSIIQLISTLLCVAIALLSTPALAVVAAPIGRNNTTRPSPDPGWDYYCRLRGSNQLNGVYIGNGWVVTVWHIGGPQDCEIGGVTYPYEAGTYIEFHENWSPYHNLNGLIAWRLSSYPNMPLLPLATKTPALGSQLTWFSGFGGGVASAEIDVGGRRCFTAGGDTSLKWGHCTMDNYLGYTTEQVEPAALICGWNMDTPDDSMAVDGNSGSPVFALEGSQWVLAGIVTGLQNYPVLYQTQVCDTEKLQIESILPVRSQIEMLRTNTTGSLWQGQP